SLVGRALPLLIPRYRCRLNLQTAFLIARRLQARGGRSKIPEPPLPIHRNPKTRHSRAGGNPDLSGFAQIGRRRDGVAD
ncbi:hypothetical protein QWX91_11635, partial [Neisseria gonorrhoeae]